MVHNNHNMVQYAAFVLDWGQVDSKIIITVSICRRWLFYAIVLLLYKHLQQRECSKLKAVRALTLVNGSHRRRLSCNALLPGA